MVENIPFMVKTHWYELIEKNVLLTTFFGSLNGQEVLQSRQLINELRDRVKHLESVLAQVQSDDCWAVRKNREKSVNIALLKWL